MADRSSPLVADLGAASTGAGGVVWSLPHGGDLDANLVRLTAHDGIGAHVNDEVDVLLIVQAGAGTLVVDDVEQALATDRLALIPKGTRRAITAGPLGMSYLSVHRMRAPMTIGSATGGGPGDDDSPAPSQ